MKVLLVGSGAREHALAWKISKSPLLTTLYAAPGNPGIADLATLVDLAVDDLRALVSFCLEKQIDLVVVGPEVPLCLGLVDQLAEVGIKAFGPHAQAAQLEGSKAYAKEFMVRHGIPTARYERFDDATKALAALPHYGLPVVIKADGLAAGKGVVIAQTANEAVEAIRSMMLNSSFGSAGHTVVIEEFLTGIEASQLCFVDHETIIPLDSSQDYKRAFDGDLGPNTGGMGTYSPSRIYNEDLQQKIHDTILVPFLNGLKKDGILYQGLVFIGLMIEDGIPKVIEFNVRFGDPETQSLMVRLESDLLVALLNTVNNNLAGYNLVWKKTDSVCVVLASGGYPESIQTGRPITGLEDYNGHASDVVVFHAGTALKDNQLITAGGRVLNVVATGVDLEDARRKVYHTVEQIAFEGAMFRRDIGI
jgi:phosphoribosylamine--glycine ligase